LNRYLSNSQLDALPIKLRTHLTGAVGLEPTTFEVEARHSIQLSYTPVLFVNKASARVPETEFIGTRPCISLCQFKVKPTVRQSGSPAVRQSGSPAVRQSGSPAVRQSGSPAVRQGFKPLPHSESRLKPTVKYNS
jgi:hypothetical protein